MKGGEGEKMMVICICGTFIFFTESKSNGLVHNEVTHPLPYALESALNCNILIFVLSGKYSKLLLVSEMLVTSLVSTYALLPCLSNLGVDHSAIWDSMCLSGFERGTGSYLQNREQKEKAFFYSCVFGKGTGFEV